jgi:hypothetical protein
MRINPIIVQKYGGACLETPAKIRAVASSLADLHSRGHRVVAHSLRIPPLLVLISEERSAISSPGGSCFALMVRLATREPVVKAPILRRCAAIDWANPRQ